MAFNRIYIELQPKQYLIPSGSGYFISDSDKFYPVSTMEEIFEKGEKSDLHIVRSDEYGVPVIKTYVYKNSVFYFNFLEATRFKILILPENWSMPVN